MSQTSADVLIIGGGIAGASAAAELSTTHRVIILERESVLGFHSTGRSAALFSEIYGNATVRALSRASRNFFFEPPPGFCEHPLVKPRGSLHVARLDQLADLRAFRSELDPPDAVRPVDSLEAREICPILRADHAVEGLYEPDAADVDVHALHQGYLKRFRQAGGRIITDAEVMSLERRQGLWHLHTRAGAFAAPIVVNAGGAWANEIGIKAGTQSYDIEPRRRTALLVEVPGQPTLDRWPLTIDIAETIYFKPDAGLLLVSPADETPVQACDVQPEEMDIALAIDRIERATTLKVERVRRRWAGLRSFAPDRSPIIGFDPDAPGFFWIAGQGGYGIQTAPAAAKLAASLLRHSAPHSDVDLASVSPARFHRSQRAASAGT